MYLTYAEYQAYGGTLDATSFQDFEFEAASWINWYTFNRLVDDDTVPEAVKRCVYRLINFAKLKADALAMGSQTISTTVNGVTTTVQTDAPIASQSNDGVSISYNTLNASDIFARLTSTGSGNEVEQMIQQMLQGVKNEAGRKVLYRGIYPDE